MPSSTACGETRSWFWFCITQEGCTLPADYIVRAWRYVYDLYENKLGLSNLVWVFSPNYTNNPTVNAMYCYPGDDVVDLVGYDWYTAGNYEIAGEGKTHEILAATGKPVALTEFGPTGQLLAPGEQAQSDDGYWNGRDTIALLERMTADGRKPAYLMSWTWHWAIQSWRYADELLAWPHAVDRDQLAAMLDGLDSNSTAWRL